MKPTTPTRGGPDTADVYDSDEAAEAAYRATYAIAPRSAFELGYFRRVGRRPFEIETPAAAAGSNAETATGAPAPRTGPALPPAEPDVPTEIAPILPFIRGATPPPDGMDPIEAYGLHAIWSARKFYGLDLTASDVLSLALAIEKGKGANDGVGKSGRPIYAIPCRDHRVRVSFDPKHHAVAAFLKPHETPAAPANSGPSECPAMTRPASAEPLKECPRHGGYNPAEPDCPVCRSSSSTPVDEPMPDFTDAEADAAIAAGRPLTRPPAYGNDKTASSISNDKRTTAQEDKKMGPVSTTPAPKPAASLPAAAGAPKPAAVPRPAAPGNLSIPPIRSTSGVSAIGISPAKKRQGKLRIALVGPSGSGKTYDALLVARGIVEGLGLSIERRGAGIGWWNYDPENGDPAGPARVLVADTEASSSNDYDQLYPFDVCNIEKPYTIGRYQQAYDQAVAGGYSVLVIDSGTHLWAGEGGLLAEVDAANSAGNRNKFEAWSKVTPKWEQFKSSIILHSQVHLLVTFRTKTAYGQDDKGKRVKVGLEPIARSEIEYEFTTVFEIDHTHRASVDKDRTGIYADRGPFVPTVETGKELISWRMSGAPEREAPKLAETAAPAAVETTAQVSDRPAVEVLNEIKTLLDGLNLKASAVKATLGLPLGPLSAAAATLVIEHLTNLKNGTAPGADVL